MGQDDGGTKAPAAAASASTSPICLPREPQAQQAARPGSVSLFSSGENSDATPTKAATSNTSGGGSRMPSPVTVELEMQRLRKEVEESRAWAAAVEQERIKSEGENQAQIHQLLAKARLLEEKVALRERQLEQQREEAKAALERQASALAGGDTAQAAAMSEEFGRGDLLEEARKVTNTIFGSCEMLN